MVHQEEDQLFKYATKEDGIGLLNLIKEMDLDLDGIDIETEEIVYNPTELVELDPTAYKTDMIMELDHVIVLTEFQSTPMRTRDDRRCRLYTALVDYARDNDKPILIFVISTAEKTKIREYKLNEHCVFRIPVISLKDFDGDEVINNIIHKLENNEKITTDEILYLALVPFMSSKNSLEEQIAKTVETLDKVRDSLETESDFAFGIELLIVEKFIKEKRQHSKLTSILRDTMRIIAEWRQEDYENGKQKGMNIEKINTAKNMIKENYSIEEIMKITQLNKKTILNL